MGGTPRLGSVDVVDDLDELVGAEAVLPGVVDEFSGSLEDCAAVGGAHDRDAAAPAELEQAFVAEEPQRAQDGVGVDVEYGGEVPCWGEAFSGQRFAVRDGAADLGGDLFVQVMGAVPADLDAQHGASHTSIIPEFEEAAMTVTANSRPPGPADQVEGVPVPQVLIEEARARARRRRRVVTAAILVLAGAWLMGLLGRGEPPPPLSVPRVQVAPPPAGPAGPTAAATIIARWGAVHDGWVLVYGDGRVLAYRDVGQVLDRRLTAKGLALVRSGAVHPRTLLRGPLSVPAGTWVDPQFTPYVPSEYAACFSGPNHPLVNGSQMLSHLPAAARGVLRGRERTYLDVDIVSRPNSDPTPPGVECSAVSLTDAPVVIASLRSAGFTIFDLSNSQAMATCGVIDRPEGTMLCLNPVLPHGSWVLWGG